MKNKTVYPTYSIMLFGLIGVFCALCASACGILLPRSYFAEEIEIHLIDTETNQPISGAVAVAHWELKGGMEGGNVVGQLQILEAVSDAQGRLFFPAWNAVRMGGALHYDSPDILIFKPGYGYTHLSNDAFSAATSPSNPHTRNGILISDWNGKTVYMIKFEGGTEKYKENIGRINTPLDYIIRDCGWKNIPKMVVSLTKQSGVFRQNNIIGGLTYTMNGYFHSNNDKLRIDCGVAPLEFFGRYMQ
jgi:hypothetical protein